MTIDTSDKNWWQLLDIITLDTEEKCAEAIVLFSDLLASMWSQIEMAKVTLAQSGTPADNEWFKKVNAAFRYAKNKRKEIAFLRDNFNRKNAQEKSTRIREGVELRHDEMLNAFEDLADILRRIEKKL